MADRKRLRRWATAGAVIAAALAGGEASAQLGPRLGGAGLPGLPGLPVVRPGEAVRGALGDLSRLDPQSLLQARLDRLGELVRRHPRELELDAQGFPAVRGEVVALSPAPEALDAATRAGFTVARRESLSELGLEEVVLQAPAGESAVRALARLRKLDPAGQYALNHVFQPAGEVGGSEAAAEPARTALGRSPARIGLIDTGVEAHAPALAGARLESRAFAEGGPAPKPHGTAVASLLVGEAPPFRGGAPGAELFAADVYGAGPKGGAVDGLLRALAWLAKRNVGVINMSLVGPDNPALASGVRALSAKGVIIVAAVGNDGPAAPPLYPASYPEVVAVTAVDARGRLLPEAGRARHLDFAAPGAEMAVARAGGGYAVARGASFAAPLVAALIARALVAPGSTGPGPAASGPAAREEALRKVAAHADRHGEGYGRGLVGLELRIAPQKVGARAPLCDGSAC